MIDKNLAFMADARTAGVVVGAHVPIVLTSRGPREPPRAFWPVAFPRPQSDQQ
jgi:phosphate acetyltransferase